MLRKTVDGSHAIAMAMAVACMTVIGAWQNSANAQQRSVEELKQLFQKIVWQQGPCIAQLGTVAQIRVPVGYRFTGPDGTRIMAELVGDPPGNKLGMIVPSNSFDWQVDF